MGRQPLLRNFPETAVASVDVYCSWVHHWSASKGRSLAISDNRSNLPRRENQAAGALQS